MVDGRSLFLSMRAGLESGKEGVFALRAWRVRTAGCRKWIFLFPQVLVSWSLGQPLARSSPWGGGALKTGIWKGEKIVNVLDALSTRYSARAYKPQPVEKEVLLKIMEAALRTPSWADTQPWEIFIAGGEVLSRLRRAFLARHGEGLPIQPDIPRPQDWPPALQRRMAEMVAHGLKVRGLAPDDEEVRRQSLRRNFEFFGAPAVLYLCQDRSLTPYSVFDLGMMAMSIMLAARELGVDSIPAVNLVGYPDILRAELDIPANLMIVMGLALGYGDPEQLVNKPRTPRRPIGDAVRLKGI